MAEPSSTSRLDAERDFTVLIWSIEHTAWWRPGAWGYTKSLSQAGRYTLEEGRQILKDANIVRVNECLIPLSCLVEIIREE